MRIASRIGIALLAMAAANGAANACSRAPMPLPPVPPAQEIANVYAKHKITSVLLVKIAEATAIPDSEGSWNAKAKPFYDLSNPPVVPDGPETNIDTNKLISFGETGSSAACMIAGPMPAKDTSWVFYMSSDRIIGRFPLRTAYDNDPKLQKNWYITLEPQADDGDDQTG